MGILSCYLSFLGHLAKTQDENLIPVIDMKTMYYNYGHDSIHDVNKVNVWELFFDQPGSYSLEEAYNSKKVYMSNAFNPKISNELFDDTRLTHEKLIKWIDIDSKYMSLNPQTKNSFEREYMDLLYGKKVLGVYLREEFKYLYEMGYPHIKGHPVQPNLVEVINMITFKQKKLGFEYVYLATEFNSSLEHFKSYFGDKLLYTERIRRPESKNLEEYFENYSKTLMLNSVSVRNYEYLKEIYLLSKCDSLVAGKSSGSIVAALWNKAMYQELFMFDLGVY
jgi:hypothetical protein